MLGVLQNMIFCTVYSERMPFLIMGIGILTCWVLSLVIIKQPILWKV